MSEHQIETAFLKRVILFDDTNERCKLEERIAQVQRDERCVQRAASLMILLAALAGVGFTYGAILQDNFSHGPSRLILKLLFEIGVASLISLAFFAGLLMLYRRKLNHLREECRGLVVRLLESRLGKPQIRASEESLLGVGDRETFAARGEFVTKPELRGVTTSL